MSQPGCSARRTTVPRLAMTSSADSTLVLARVTLGRSGVASGAAVWAIFLGLLLLALSCSVTLACTSRVILGAASMAASWLMPCLVSRWYWDLSSLLPRDSQSRSCAGVSVSRNSFGAAGLRVGFRFSTFSVCRTRQRLGNFPRCLTPERPCNSSCHLLGHTPDRGTFSPLRGLGSGTFNNLPREEL